MEKLTLVVGQTAGIVFNINLNSKIFAIFFLFCYTYSVLMFIWSDGNEKNIYFYVFIYLGISLHSI